MVPGAYTVAGACDFNGINMTRPRTFYVYSVRREVRNHDSLSGDIYRRGQKVLMMMMSKLLAMNKRSLAMVPEWSACSQ